ncbi:hypothetical protein LTR17_022582 [Elasticomyces elasticus]|nr:hypothetical protein LTR17_022582 [Elasticomyces elasticus]
MLPPSQGSGGSRGRHLDRPTNAAGPSTGNSPGANSRDRLLERTSHEMTDRSRSPAPDIVNMPAQDAAPDNIASNQAQAAQATPPVPVQPSVPMQATVPGQPPVQGQQPVQAPANVDALGIKLLHTKKFYITAAILLAANIALLAALGYLLTRLDEYQYRPKHQNTVAWSIYSGVFALLLIVGLVTWLVFRRSQALLTESRRKVRTNWVRGFASRKLPAGSIIGTEFVAFFAIVGYFYGSATHSYFRLVWESESNIVSSALAPGLALFGGYNDAASASFTEGWRSCTFPAYNTSCDALFSERPAKWTDDSPYGTVAYYTFNATNSAKFTDPAQQLKLQTNVQWDSKQLKNLYNTSAPQNPTLHTVMYDQRLTDEQFREALRCGIIGWTEQPALGSSTYTIDQVTRTHDVLGKLTGEIPDPTCKTLAETLYKLDDGYIAYRYHVTSSGTSYANVCDTNGTGQSEDACVTQVIIRYGSFSTTKLTSKHGKEIKDIILDIGSILGAVQYAAWFFTIFQ